MFLGVMFLGVMSLGIFLVWVLYSKFIYPMRHGNLDL